MIRRCGCAMSIQLLPRTAKLVGTHLILNNPHWGKYEVDSYYYCRFCL